MRWRVFSQRLACAAHRPSSAIAHDARPCVQTCRTHHASDRPDFSSTCFCFCFCFCRCPFPCWRPKAFYTADTQTTTCCRARQTCICPASLFCCATAASPSLCQSAHCFTSRSAVFEPALDTAASAPSALSALSGHAFANRRAQLSSADEMARL